MSDLARGERLQIMLTADELAVLDSWRFERRMPSRAAAVRELLKRGLASEGFVVAEGGNKSEDFRITGGSTASPTRDRRHGTDGHGED
jgi:hypothetical protein